MYVQQCLNVCAYIICFKYTTVILLFTLQVNCLSGVCQMGGIPSDDDFPDQSQGNQWWRFLIPLIFHMGIIHLLIIVMIQLYIGIKIERTAGWLRVGLIYIISGIGGNLVCVLSPVCMCMCGYVFNYVSGKGRCWG